MTLTNIGGFIGWVFSIFGSVYQAIMSNWLLAMLIGFVLISGIVTLFISVLKRSRRRS